MKSARVCLPFCGVASWKASAPVFSFSHDGKSWQEGTSSATRAAITLQKPVRIALHARQLILVEMEQLE